MVVVGADVHKRTHTFVAVDQVGKQVGQLTVAATTKSHHRALAWARKAFDGQELVWAIEGCRHLSARLERDLLTAGQKVVRVPPKMMAMSRGSAGPAVSPTPSMRWRWPGRSCGNRACRWPPTMRSRELKLLVDRRESSVGTRTRTINSLSWRVHELDPAHAPKPRSLDQPKHQQALRSWLQTLTGIVAELAGDELEDVIALTGRVNALHKRICVLVEKAAPSLLAMPGCGALTAAKLLGESAGIDRLADEAKFARHAGVAPIPVWSGNTSGRVRMTRSGTVNGAPPCTASPSPRSASTAAWVRPTTRRRSRKACPPPRHCVA